MLFLCWHIRTTLLNSKVWRFDFLLQDVHEGCWGCLPCFFAARSPWKDADDAARSSRTMLSMLTLLFAARSPWRMLRMLILFFAARSSRTMLSMLTLFFAARSPWRMLSILNLFFAARSPWMMLRSEDAYLVYLLQDLLEGCWRCFPCFISARSPWRRLRILTLFFAARST